MKCTRTLLKFAPIVYLWRCRVEYSHHQYTIQVVKAILLNQKVTSETCYYEINVGFKLVLVSNAIRESYLPRLLPSWNLRCHCKCRIWNKWCPILNSVCSQKPWLFFSLDHHHHKQRYSRKKRSWSWYEQSPFLLCTRPWMKNFFPMLKGLSPT